MTGIDFLPADYVQRRHQRRRRVYDRLLLAALLLLAAGGIAEPLIQQAAWTDRVTRLRAELAQREARFEPVETLTARLRQIEDEQRLWKLLRWRYSPTELFDVFSHSIPEEVHLTNVEWTLYGATPAVNTVSTSRDQDLELLCQRRQSEQVVLLVQGVAMEDCALTRWLTALHDAGSFARIDVLSLDQQPVQDIPQRTFSLRLQLVNPLAVTPAPPVPPVENGPRA